MPPSVDVEEDRRFPVESLTDEQREILSIFIQKRKEDRLNSKEPLWFALVLAGVRPATEITVFGPPERDDKELTPEDVAESFGLSYRWTENVSIDVARNEWRFELLPSNTTFTEAHHKRFGTFYGYSKEDIDYFIHGLENDTTPGDIVADGAFDVEEVAYTTFLPQGHEASIDGYEKAIELGKEYRATISKCAELWELPELSAYADIIYHEAIADAFIDSS